MSLREVREELIERIGKMDRISLERVKSLLEWEAFDYSALPDVRVKRTGEQVSEFKRLLQDLAQPDQRPRASESPNPSSSVGRKVTELDGRVAGSSVNG